MRVLRVGMDLAPLRSAQQALTPLGERGRLVIANL